jgi:hypothetical protein
MVDPRTDPVGWVAEVEKMANRPLPPSRPWATIPFRSVAPVAVQAIRIRRVLREAVRARCISWNEEAHAYMRKFDPENPMHQWAATWLGVDAK